MSIFSRAMQSRSVIEKKKLKTCSSRWIILGTPQCVAVAMAASTTRVEKQQQGDSRPRRRRFDTMHDALASEAHAVARDFGVDVLTVMFRPDHTAGRADEAPSSTSSSASRRLVAADMSAMGPAKLAVHAARLRALVRCRGRRRRRNRGVAPGGVEINLPGAARSKASEDFKGQKKEKLKL
jgi:hypothetical protein